jgi:hypothetical protein
MRYHGPLATIPRENAQDLPAFFLVGERGFGKAEGIGSGVMQDAGECADAVIELVEGYCAGGTGVDKEGVVGGEGDVGREAEGVHV